MQAKDVKNCRYCGSEISASAKVCPTCRYYQSSWRNLIVFYAGITGFITLVISGFAFIAGRTTDIYKNWTWKDEVQVISLDTGLFPNFSVAISNLGNGPVFVSDIVLSWRAANATFAINQRIDADDILKFGSKVHIPERDYNLFVSSHSGSPSQPILREANLDGETTPEKHCFLTVYYLPDSTNIERMNDHYGRFGQKLVTERASARVIFFSLHSRAKLQREFPVVVTFLRSAAERCQAIPFE